MKKVSLWIGWIGMVGIMAAFLSSCAANTQHKKYGKTVRKCDGRRGVMTPMGPM